MLDPSLLLFVPGDRPDRFAKALASAASGAILDLEDAVAPASKPAARDAAAAFARERADRERVWVRVNPLITPWGEDDLAALHGVPLAGVVIPKASARDELEAVARVLPGVPQLAIIESARGMLRAEAIAEMELVAGLAFGPYDLAAELHGESSWEAMATHRAHVLLAARAAGRWAIDGPSSEYGDATIPARDARAARALGYDGKLLIHPAQIAPVRDAFTPDAAAIAYARRVLEVAATASPAVLDGTMIDQPFITAAQRVLRRAGVPA